MLLRHNFFRNLEQKGTHADAEIFRKRDLKFLFNQAMEAYDQRINKLTASSDRGSCNPPLVFTPVGGLMEDVFFLQNSSEKNLISTLYQRLFPLKKQK